MSKSPQYFELSKYSLIELKGLENYYRVSTVHSGIPSYRIDKNKVINRSLSLKQMKELSPIDCLNFIKRNFYDYWKPHTNDKQFAALEAQTEKYFSSKITAIGFFSQDKMVGLVLADVVSLHPATKRPAVHIGYFGYDKIAVSTDEAEFIKYHAMETVADLCIKNRNISAIGNVDSFNEPCLRFIKKAGMLPILIRLDEKL